jgi:NDP-sugar pyrophosphorylase family protein
VIDIPVGTPAIDAFWAIQQSDGVGAIVRDERVTGTVVDHRLRRAHLDGIDLTAAPVEDFAGDRVPSAPASVTAVVMAGGQGSRLRPLTDRLPKPLLSVGHTSILGRLLENLARASTIGDVYIAVNYMADAIEERIGDGSEYGVRVRYLREREPLGGAGPLTLLPERPTGPVLVLNADQITTLQFDRMVEYHHAEAAPMTMGAFVHDVAIPYGVLHTDGVRLVRVEEKPTARFTCNAGFYVVDADALDLVPPGRLSTMVDLVDALMARGDRVSVFPVLERWIDIGTPEELEAALMWAATGEED